MKKQFLTILTASIIFLGFTGFANKPVETANVQIQKIELPDNVY